jgi:hypothetical protein
MEDCCDKSMAATAYGERPRRIHGGSGVWRTVAADPWRPRLSPEATNESATKQREKWSRGRGQQLDAGDRVAGWRLRPAALGERRRRQGLRGEAEGEVEQGGVGRRKSGDG